MIAGNRVLAKVTKVLVVALPATWLVACAVLVLVIHRTGAIDRGERADVIVVLGASLSRDGQPNKALIRRSEHAAALWKAGRAGTILCTGGIGPRLRVARSEADACREIVVRHGVPATAVVLEDRSRNTEEQMRNVGALIRRYGWARAMLVSDSYHVFRARYIIRRMGFDVALSPVPAATIGPLFYVMSVVREVAAMHGQVLR
jgi:uncharacterized SAM-binding protein YcdF (DUF218 family)